MSTPALFLVRAVFWSPVALVVILLVDNAYLGSYLTSEWRDPLLVPGLIGVALLISMIGCLIVDAVPATSDRGRRRD